MLRSTYSVGTGIGVWVGVGAGVSVGAGVTSGVGVRRAGSMRTPVEEGMSSASARMQTASSAKGRQRFII